MFTNAFAALAILTAGPVIAQDSLDQPSKAFLKEHCFKCHNAEKQKGKFRLDNLGTDFANPQIAEKWSEVVFRLNAAEMPPEDEPQPSAQAIGRMADYLTKKIREGAAARMAKLGPVQHYRLSRPEYAYTVYDLLGVMYDVEAPGALNEDPRWHGFDRIGALLSTAPSHIDRYLKAADTVVELAFPDRETASKVGRRGPKEGKRQLLQLGENYGALDVKVPGRYRLKIRVSGLSAFTGRRPSLAIWHHEQLRIVHAVELDTPPGETETVEYEGLFVRGSYQVRNHARSQRHPNDAYRLFRNEEIDADKPLSELQGGFFATRTKIVDDEGRPVMPLLLVDWIEAEGPILDDEVRNRRKLMIPEKEDDPAEIRACLQRFAELAWRRPVLASEIEPYAMFVASEQKAGESFRSAYRAALSSLLVARRFFNLEVGSPGEKRTELNDFELASRLSYFLWSSMPDEDLFEAARNGELRSLEKLAEQFDRMVADPKIDRFLDSFPRQWLQLHRVGMFQPDPNLYPSYDPWLEDSMKMETVGYFAEMFRENLPLRELVDSKWTMMNSRLASHYGMSAPEKGGFQRVNVDPKSGRGGLLTQAAILSLTSDGTRHRPVHRGAWLSEAILARTPPPPPPNVDPLEPVPSDKPKTTIRAQLERHATDPNCVSCHAKIDPLGLAFENFDAIGRWRDTERVLGGKGKNPPVDASGELPGGRKFANATEFKKHLAADERLDEAFLEQVATYALRRVPTVDDKTHLRSILASIPPGERRLRNMIRGLVLSELFRRK